MIQYTKVLKKVSIFRERKKEMEFLLRRIEINFFEPEQELMRQQDSSFRKVVITGQGICNVYRNFNSRKRVLLGTLVEGSLTGETCVIFNSDPVNTVMAMSYCTIGMINEQNFLEFLSHFTKMKKFIID